MCRVLILSSLLLRNQLTCLNVWIFLNQSMKVQQNLPIRPTRVYANHGGNSSQNRGASALTQNYSTMSDISGKHRKIYVDRRAGKQEVCLIHGPEYSSDEFKTLGDLGSKYVEGKPTKDCRKDTVSGKKFNRQQENTDIVNSAVDEILLHENQKLSPANEAPENIESDLDPLGYMPTMAVTAVKIEEHPP